MPEVREVKNLKVGACWVKETEQGRYFSCKLNNGISCAIYKNDRKETEQQPDWNIVMEFEGAERMELISDFDKARIKEGTIVPKRKEEKPVIDDNDLDDIEF
jgi:uncharacterized protein (DUF736 family)